MSDMIENTKKDESKRLSVAMLKHAGKVYELLSPQNVDISFLQPYRDMLQDSLDFDQTSMVVYASKFLYALDQCIEASIVANAMVSIGKNRLAQESAASRLLRAPDYFKSIQVKSTEALSDAFIDQDPLCIKEIDTLNQWKVLYDFFDKNRQSFENWHNWIKKMYDVESQTLLNSQRMRAI